MADRRLGAGAPHCGPSLGTKATGLGTDRVDHTAWRRPSPRRHLTDQPSSTLDGDDAGHAGNGRSVVCDLRAHAADGRAGDPLLAERRASTTSTSVRSAPTRRSSTAGCARARRRRRRWRRSAGGAAARGWLQTLLGTRPRVVEETVASEPILRRLSDQELAMVEAADLFNASQYRRTVGGICEVARRAACLGRHAVGNQRRSGRDGRVGHQLVPVPRLARTRTTRSGSRGAATIPSSSRARSRAGTPT